jgi:4-amino-4-deoxy-L-arabinose transferase-like glycosyltransferase
MSTIAIPAPRGPAPAAADPAVSTSAVRRPLLARLVRGRPGDPEWVRPALFALLMGTAVAYVWGLDASGWGNSFYAAAVQAGTKSWKAMFFGSFDSSNFITVDKPPASLWVMELSSRLFGLNSWSLLVPQALEGVATVAVLYAAVRRWASPAAGLLAGLVVAVTPVAALMFRFDNPDALLVLLLTAAGYATVRAIDSGRTRWLVLAGALVGFGFLTKELQALLVVPALATAYLLAGPPRLARRLWQLVVSGVTLVAASGWWIAAVELTPAADRPYIGGSQNNSLWNVIFGYNGFGRLTGNESGSVGGGGFAGQSGLTRLFGSDMGAQISWLIPAALMLLVAGLWWTSRQPRTDRSRAGLVIWGGSMVVTGLVFSYGRGIIHPYYTVALAPLVGGTLGIGAWLAWARRDSISGRAVLAAVTIVTGAWAATLLDRTPAWAPWLRTAIFGLALAGAVGLLVWPSLRLRGARFVVAVAALLAALLGPAGYAYATVTQPHSGAIVSAGPAGSGGGPRGGSFRPGVTSGGTATFGGPSALGGTGAGPGGALPGGSGFGGGRTPGGSSGGGLLAGGSISAGTAKALEAGGHYRWLVATVGSENASTYQLATGQAVMSIGGFNGTDPSPTLAQFEAYVAAHEIHWFIAAGGGGPLGAAGGGGPAGGSGPGGSRGGPQAGGGASSDASQITTWVEDHFSETTIGGVTVYDLTSPK